MSFSVPTSPAMTRSSKAQPVTPQRLPRQQPRSHSFYRSPGFTPSTSPYTPISLRSLDSTSSSTLTTPDSFGSSLKKRLNFNAGSPDVLRSTSAAQDKSLADIAENWRSRANENGIKVAYANQNDSSYVPDDSSDMSLSDVAPDSSTILNEKALFSAPFVSTHRRLNSLPIINRPRAQSQASLPPFRMHPLSPVTSRTNNRALHMASPTQSRRVPSNLSHPGNIMSTPPPNRALVSQLKLKGSMTDPAQPRRREAFSSLATPSIAKRTSNMSFTLEPNTSLDLFDIDENDFEQESDYQGPEVENSFSRDLQALQSNNFGYPTFSQHPQSVQQPIFNQQHFADPFQPLNRGNGQLHNAHVLNGLSDGMEQHFHASRQQHTQKAYYDEGHHTQLAFYNHVPHLQPQYNQVMSHNYPAFVPIPQPTLLPFQPIPIQPSIGSERTAVTRPQPTSVPEPAPTDCSVCLASKPVSLAILQPCRHPLCSACLTSALNIVGEKDMECAVCKQSVADFKLVMGTSKGDKTLSASSPSSPFGRNERNIRTPQPLDASPSLDTKSYLETSIVSSRSSFQYEDSNDSIDGLESAFEFGLDFNDLRASTPKLEQTGSSDSFSLGSKKNIKTAGDNIVLRIDNVPWDITPLQITKWLQQPVERVHVLLDSKGKTLSHAYVEVKDATIAGAILRGEARGKKERGSVLGRGRRARGVTVTRSGQQELMADLFPRWRGGFDGSRPSLAGLEGDRIIGALEGGLLSEQEICALLVLIREPDSHFLKVPALPFHSLISILSKFPPDVDSRVFWSTGVRDRLLEAAYTAVQVLLERVEKAKEHPKPSGQDEEYTADLVINLLHTALNCKAFTAHQIHKLTGLAQTYSLPLPDIELMEALEASTSYSTNDSSSLRTPPRQDISLAMSGHHYQSMYHPVAQDNSNASLDDLAREFGVDTQVVQALAQRLAKLC